VDKCQFFVLKVDSVTLGHAYKLQPSHCRVDTCKYFFYQSFIGPWKGMPASKEHFSSLGCL